MVGRPEEFRMPGYQVNYQEISIGEMECNIRSLHHHQRYHDPEIEAKLLGISLIRPGPRVPMLTMGLAGSISQANCILGNGEARAVSQAG
jgi:hypothetical protein